MQLPLQIHVTRLTMALVAFILVALTVIVIQLVFWQKQASQLKLLQANQSEITESGQVAIAQLNAAESQAAQLSEELAKLKAGPDHKKYEVIESLVAKFAGITDKVSRNNNASLDTAAITGAYGTWGQYLLEKKYEELAAAFAKAEVQLDEQYAAHQKSLVAAQSPQSKPASKTTPVTENKPQADGYSHTNVATSRGSFDTYLIKLPLSSVRVRTVAASSSKCGNNCPAKSLAQFVSESGAYAGINGTYFCPPDYSWCAGKTNTYDFAFYNTPTGGWINQSALGWDSEGLATFNGHTAKFYRFAKDFTGGSVTAGIANFPPLLVHNASIVITDAQMDAGQKGHGRRGVLGVDANNIYLAIVNNASLMDVAHVMRSLGATEALNLDGGGSAALYIGGDYKVGPGRQLPNAIVLVK